MIIWRDGKAGFVGAAKRLIKGFFTFQYTLTTADVISNATRHMFDQAINRDMRDSAISREMFDQAINRDMTDPAQSND